MQPLLTQRQCAEVRFVKEHPVSLCVQDEFGRLLAKLRDPRSNERMREFWALGPGSIYNSSAGAAQGDDSECIKNARLSILGFGVPGEFYSACQAEDIDNGFSSPRARPRFQSPSPDTQ